MAHANQRSGCSNKGDAELFAQLPLGREQGGLSRFDAAADGFHRGTPHAVVKFLRQVGHAIIDCQTPGQTFTPAPCSIRKNQKTPVGFTYPVGGTEYDPAQPIQFRQGDELYFFWQLAKTVTPVPVVTLFLRFDTSLTANQSYL